jgi:hypothetical protein
LCDVIYPCLFPMFILWRNTVVTSFTCAYFPCLLCDVIYPCLFPMFILWRNAYAYFTSGSILPSTGGRDPFMTMGGWRHLPVFISLVFILWRHLLVFISHVFILWRHFPVFIYYIYFQCFVLWRHFPMFVLGDLVFPTFYSLSDPKNTQKAVKMNLLIK